MKTNPCCNKCRSEIHKCHIGKPISGVHCSNPTCECHIVKNKLTDISKEEAEKLMANVEDEIISFISSLLLSQHDQLKTRYEGEVREAYKNGFANGAVAQIKKFKD